MIVKLNEIPNAKGFVLELQAGIFTKDEGGVDRRENEQRKIKKIKDCLRDLSKTWTVHLVETPEIGTIQILVVPPFDPKVMLGDSKK